MEIPKKPVQSDETEVLKFLLCLNLARKAAKLDLESCR